jgi:hypothetical protein
VRTPLGASLLSAGIGALIWIVISFATGGKVLFALGGGILCGVVIFIIGYSFSLLFMKRRKPAA